MGKQWKISQRYFSIVLVEIAANQTPAAIFPVVPKLMHGVLFAGFGKLPKMNRIDEDRLFLARFGFKLVQSLFRLRGFPETLIEP
jgi:hypothetical protein